MAFIDLQKAYDSVDRELLIMEFNKIGLPGQFAQLVANIYGSKKAVVRVFGKGVSRIFEQTRDVKQGSALSPRLFGIFVNDIVEFLEKRWAPTVKLGNRMISALLFTDDMALVAKTSRELQILIDLMAEYLESKKLRLNLGKTEIMIFNKGGRRNLVENEKFRFKGQEIKVVEKAKYLGFTLTPNCSWKEHVSEMSKRGKAVVGSILRNDKVIKKVSH